MLTFFYKIILKRNEMEKKSIKKPLLMIKKLQKDENIFLSTSSQKKETIDQC